jgi:hypothetical protein
VLSSDSAGVSFGAQRRRSDLRARVGREPKKNLRFSFAAALVVAGALAAPSTAHALEGPGHPTVTLGFLAGYGTEPSGLNYNPYDGAIGGRAGISLYDIYFGASFHYHFGAQNTLATANVYTIGGELGYDIRPIEPVTIRPYVALGNEGQRVASGPVTYEQGRFYLAPGILALLKVYGPLTAGVDMRYVFPFRSGNDRQDLFSFGIFGTIGLTL